LQSTFEWDAEKARRNVDKPGISFGEAVTAFGDPLSVTIFDPDYSDSEDGRLLMEMSRRSRLVVVAFTERSDRLRIVAARLASRREKRKHEEG
jgi:hypothetical protein